MEHEESQKLELARREGDLLVSDRDLPRPEIHVKVSERERSRQLRRAPGEWTHSASQNGPHPRNELTRREGLREVIVGPQFKSEDPVALLSQGGEHDNRDGRIASQP